MSDQSGFEVYETGAHRDTREGKGRFDLLPPRALARLARHFEAGAEKYGDRNWEKGIPVSRFIDSGLRHIFSFLEGKTNEDHLIAGVWNLLAAAEMEERVKASLLPADVADIGGMAGLLCDTAEDLT